MSQQVRKVLIVDDESSHRMLAKRALKTIVGLSVTEAETVDRATLLIERELDTLSFAIVDLNLGGESGIEVLELLRSFRSIDELPVAVLSTSELMSDIEASYIAGASCYLVKSSDPKCFSEEILSAARFFLRQS